MSEKPKKALRGLFQKTEHKLEGFATTTTKVMVSEAPESEMTKSEMSKVSVSKNQSLFEDIAKFDAQFENTAIQRHEWKEADYLNIFNKIDKAQSEAFLLKGKLLLEVKNKFFETNQMGWKDFCAEKLCLYYTTANQYIRVAAEFSDFTRSGVHSSFGFEHFKALLPLPLELRQEVLMQHSTL
jgi:hypothetical protein